ncbi:MAG: DUF6089 family protein, partial [Bacteroidota bacterium]
PGASLGVMSYTGDVAPNINPTLLGIGIEGFLRYNVTPALTVRANALISLTQAKDEISADKFQVIRNVNFNASVTELSMRLEYNFRDFRARTELRKLSPYAFVGGGVAWISTDGNYLDNDQVTPVLPFGVGFKYALPFNVNFGMELGARKTFTDQIDGLDPAIFDTKFQSTNSYNDDMYYFIGVSISYTYDVGGICPIRFR